MEPVEKTQRSQQSHEAAASAIGAALLSAVQRGDGGTNLIGTLENNANSKVVEKQGASALPKVKETPDNESQLELARPCSHRNKADYAIRFPEYMPHEHVDDSMLERYCEFCASSGLSPEQAQQAVDFYLAEQRLANEEGVAHCEAVLRQVWQGNFQRRLALARRAAAVMNKRLEGRLSPLLAAGLGNNPVFAELMALVGEAVSEDSIGISHGGAELFRPMSTEEFLRTEVFKGK